MNIWTLLFSLLAGWLAGGLANWAADTLPVWGQPAHTSLVLSALPRYWFPRRQEAGARRVLLLDLAMAALFLCTAFLFAGRPVLLGIAWLYGFFLLTVLVIDLEQRRVLNVMLGPAALVVLALSFAPGTPAPLSALLGGAVGFGLFLLLALVGRGALGAGDVKLAGVIGLMTGFPHVINALLLGVVLGGAAALALLLSRRATRKSTMAYAPYLALGAILTLWRVWGG